MSTINIYVPEELVKCLSDKDRDKLIYLLTQSFKVDRHNFSAVIGTRVKTYSLSSNNDTTRAQLYLLDTYIAVLDENKMRRDDSLELTQLKTSIKTLKGVIGE